jgi:hypothetical protein
VMSAERIFSGRLMSSGWRGSSSWFGSNPFLAGLPSHYRDHKITRLAARAILRETNTASHACMASCLGSLIWSIS